MTGNQTGMSRITSRLSSCSGEVRSMREARVRLERNEGKEAGEAREALLSEEESETECFITLLLLLTDKH